MHVAKEHLEQLSRAIHAAEPILVLPRLHPRYIQALLSEWVTAPGSDPKRQVRIIESHVGSRKLEPNGIKAGSSLDRGSDLKTFLLNANLPTANGWQHIWWMPDLDADWSDSGTTALLASLCRDIATRGLPLRVAVGAPSAEAPVPLRPWMRTLELLAPKARQDGRQSFAVDVLEHDGDPRLSRGKALLREVVDTAGSAAAVSALLQGLDAAAINVVIEAAASWAMERGEPARADGEDWKELKALLDRERKRQLQRASGLSVQQPSEEELKGMHRFQRYLDYVSVLFHDHRYQRVRHNGPVPRGVLLVGLPGCGKSLAAAVTARKLDVPLLKMDVGAMLGRYLGESEANLSRALDAAEAAAPCVLWVDEIDKALGGLGSSEGGGTGLRMLGQLLTWMQEHRSAVYLFATANRVSDPPLPPELLRRGRFDELWCVTLPEHDERRDILLSKLSALGERCDAALLNPSGAPLAKLVAATEGYSGADIKSLVHEAWMVAAVFYKPVTAKVVMQVISDGFLPMSRQFGDSIKKEVEALEKHGFRNVWCEPANLPKPVPADRTVEGGRLPDVLGELWWAERAHTIVFHSKGSASGALRYELQISVGMGGKRQVEVVQVDRAKKRKSRPISATLVRHGTDLRIEGLSNKRKTNVNAVLTQADGDSFATLVVGRTAYQQRAPAKLARIPSQSVGGTAGQVIGKESKRPTSGEYSHQPPWLVWAGVRVTLALPAGRDAPMLKVGRKVVGPTALQFSNHSSFLLKVESSEWSRKQGLADASIAWNISTGVTVSGVQFETGTLRKVAGDWPTLAKAMYQRRSKRR